MKRLILLFGILLGISTFSQATEKQEENVYSNVDRAATFKDGIPSFRNEFAKNIKTNKIKGKGVLRTELTFVVERDGTLSDIKATGSSESFNEQAIKAIKKIKTAWNPGMVKGTPVRSRFRFPATLRID